MCFFNLAEQAYLEQNVLFPTLNTMIFRMYSFTNLLTSQAKNVLYDPASNTVGFLSRDTCVSTR
jgi:hypothetical protein